MTTRSENEFLIVQLLETRRLKELAAGHPFMMRAFEERQAEIESKIEALASGGEEAKPVQPSDC